MAQNEDVTLYFIADSVPSAADESRALLIPGIVRFRNVSEDDGKVEDSTYVTSAPDVDIPSQYDEVDIFSPETPILTIFPAAITIDLSDVEHADLRAIALFPDGTQTDVTTSCAWTSATEAAATVGAATGIVTPIGAGSSVITATYPWEAPGEGTRATATLTAQGAALPVADEVVVVGANTYVWKAAPTTVALQVKIGATVAECLENLAMAISAGPGAGTKYGSLTVKHPTVIVTGLTATVLSLAAKTPGATGGALASTETGTAFAYADTTFVGGTSPTGIADTATVTVAA